MSSNERAGMALFASTRTDPLKLAEVVTDVPPELPLAVYGSLPFMMAHHEETARFPFAR